ncbi:MAG: nucleotidyltransferase domain-containing protein [Deltaproteobacteria bacterium]|nr:nucleotidyltransferase domain-containing protein [Deltaproteobacteria bacterium]
MNLLQPNKILDKINPVGRGDLLPMKKEQLLNLMKDVLLREERVLFAYAYGSFLSSESFRDLDIGIYVRNPEDNPFVLSTDIKTSLSLLARVEQLGLTADHFDVQIINQAPFTFLKRIFQEGILLLDRDPDLRTDLVEQVSLKYRECAGILAETSLR